jgi:hypothetical protein
MCMEDNSKKKVFKTPAVHTVELNYDAFLCLSSDPNIINPYENELDWN